MSDQPLIQVEASPTFSRNLRVLAKKYRSIRNDIQHVIEQLDIAAKDIQSIIAEYEQQTINDEDDI